MVFFCLFKSARFFVWGETDVIIIKNYGLCFFNTFKDYTDVQRKFKVAKYLPKSWVEFWCLHWPPVVVSKIDGLKDKKEEIKKSIDYCV
ncbi:MAG: hypothetical protein A2Y98_01175 [Candidatus Portnoybacteria bacterium RBG_19FT_COMBO_36_7]|uniref:Uncharacterized protein n=1 Tax=Candidatus Portnoybacteria bacterium RBG_19FT_COMBO_36_7 TaxID=1801992 RepID=A0A1G2F7E2_9BACT|nr:MAG: hypothetical protein A2Y98_01175 [Candidatus Portnoybacteria bacterium RBG_19FT_COMBO_36_7]